MLSVSAGTSGSGGGGGTPRRLSRIHLPRTTGDRDHASALCEAAVTLAERAGAQAIVAVTRGGGTARRLAALRPHAPILATTDSEHTAPRLSLLWGVLPVYTDIPEEGEAARQIGQELVERGLLRKGTDAVFVSINSDLSRRDANFLKIHRV